MALVRSAAAEGPDEARLDLWLLLDAHAHHLGTILLHLPHHEMRHWLLGKVRWAILLVPLRELIAGETYTR
jgi:hypothetical protein